MKGHKEEQVVEAISPAGQWLRAFLCGCFYVQLYPVTSLFYSWGAQSLPSFLSRQDLTI